MKKNEKKMKLNKKITQKVIRRDEIYLQKKFFNFLNL